LDQNLVPTEYWQADDPLIIGLARSLKTASAIYRYVAETLTYDLERVRPNIDRLGAAKALENKESAICMEYTDLFIALARAAGIPAREVNGFAYTENPEIQPLSLVADVLHAWPEYWNAEKQTWVPVDPTWGSTTNGVDFFNKLDLRHFAFVVHGGDDPNQPFAPGSYKLGPNPQKDVFVNFGQLPTDKKTMVQILADPQKSIPFLDSKLKIIVKNPGPTAIYNLKTDVYFESDLADTFYLDSLLPFASKSFVASIPFSFLGLKTPEKAVVVAGEARVEVPTFKNQVIIYPFGFCAMIFVIAWRCGFLSPCCVSGVRPS